MGNADPVKTGHAKGPATVTASLGDSTDVEEYLPAPNPSRAQRRARIRPSCLTRSIRRSCLRLVRGISQIVGPEKAVKPSGSTVLWYMLGFIVLLAFGCIAVAYPFRPTLITGGIVAFLMFFSLVVLTAIDLKSHGMIKTSVLIYTFTKDNRIEATCLSEKLRKYDTDDFPCYSLPDTSLCLPLVPQPKQESTAVQSRHSGEHLHLRLYLCPYLICLSRMRSSSQPLRCSKTATGHRKPPFVLIL